MTTTVPPTDIAPVTIEEEMRRSYLDYAMMEGGYDWSKVARKSARIVGDVMGKYHPHGDASIYDALVRMAQDFNMRYPLITGQTSLRFWKNLCFK